MDSKKGWFQEELVVGELLDFQAGRLKQFVGRWEDIKHYHVLLLMVSGCKI